MYLVDTNVISALSPSRPASAALVAWMDAQSSSLFLSVVTIAEVEDGIAKLRREKAMRRSRDLAQWLDAVLHLYGDRILTFDTAAARLAGELSDRARGRGHAPGFADIIIAATARQHALTILSRNVRHFGPLGVPVLDPFTALPPS
ncbi:type II toxin-antitoxin system VapC family toxin [Bradyrhizobium sp. 18BD]